MRRAIQIVLLALVAGYVAIYAVPYPTARLEGGPLIITDARGVVLRSLPSADGRRAAWTTLDALPSSLIDAVLVSEDGRFFDHPGVDARGLLRAAWLDLRAGRAAYGGSTLTMQLVRMLDPRPRTALNKLREAVLALRLERALDKRAILEQYLNRACYGHGAYGVEAAAQLYFGKPASGLSVAEATLLAVVPRSPSAYDPVAHLDRALARRDRVLARMAAEGRLDAGEVERARAQPLAPAFHPPPFRAPHFVDWLLPQLPDEARRRGGVVTSTLDLGMQEELERRLAEHVAGLAEQGVQQAGAVVLETESGAVRAMVGSTDFGAEQLNITARRRHPGSALKPFVYALALEAGDSPATLALDVAAVPSAYQVAGRRPPEHGPVRYREALAGSYNLAAVHVLERVGIERLVSKLREAGLAVPGGPESYGLRMALGSLRVRLVDLAAAYGFLARAGRVTRARGIAEIRLPGGATWRPPRGPETRLFSPETSWQVMDMLADEDARHPAFGRELPFDDLGYRVAAKTGTARGFSDTVAVAVTREVTVAAWAGTFDGEPTEGLVAMRAAAPLARAGLQIAARGRELTLPDRPAGIISVEVCPVSGLLPSPACPHRKLEYFEKSEIPTRMCMSHM